MAIKSQAGMSSLSMLSVIILVLGSILLVMKIVPIYLDDLVVKKALNAMSEESGLETLSKKNIRKILYKRLQSDYSNNLNDDEVKIIKGSNELRIEIHYESRVPLISNLDLVAKFEHLYVKSL